MEDGVNIDPVVDGVSDLLIPTRARGLYTLIDNHTYARVTQLQARQIRGLGVDGAFITAATESGVWECQLRYRITPTVEKWNHVVTDTGMLALHHVSDVYSRMGPVLVVGRSKIYRRASYGMTMDTSDRGDTAWRSQPLPLAPGINRAWIAAVYDTLYLLTGRATGPLELVRSPDAGQSWEQSVKVPNVGTLFAFSSGLIERGNSTTASVALFLHGDNGLRYSTDRGYSWQQMALPVTPTGPILHYAFEGYTDPSDSGTSFLLVPDSAGVQAFRMNGDGSFDPPRTISTELAAGETITSAYRDRESAWYATDRGNVYRFTIERYPLPLYEGPE
jgi:hypothetical protein